MTRAWMRDTWPLNSVHLFPRTVGASFVLVLSACGGGGGGDTAFLPGNDDVSNLNGSVADAVIDVSDPNQCNGPTQKQWAYDSMRDFYLFYDQVPIVDPQSFESANDVVRNVRFQERDDFSHVTDCLLYTSPSPRDRQKSRMPSSA